MAQYINYGDLLVDLETLMTNLANDVLNYVANQPWSRKRKEKFMYAYTDLINRGILGASNNSGQWVLDIKGDPFPEMGKKDKEMYGEAAYFIQQQMAKLPTKASIEEEEKKKLEEEKAKLIPFNSDTFKNEFLNQLSKDWFGGNNEILASLWNEYDKRNTQKTGLRDRTRRAEMFSQTLDNYLANLEANKDKYNFENSPLGDLETFKRKVEEAKAALTTTDNTDDDFEKLNALGLNASTFFSNGSEDPYKTEGYEGTYGDYYGKFLPQLEKDKAKAEQEKLKLQRANQYTNYKFFGQGLMGTPPTGSDALQRLNTYVSLPKLDGNQQSELVGAFRFAEKNGILKNLSKEELLKFGSRWMSTPSRLKKIDGLNGFYWDSVGQRVILPYNRSNVPTMGFLDLINLNSPESKQALAKSQLVKQMNLPIQGSLDLSDLSNFGFDEATGNELWAVINDIGAFVDPEAISGTALALNAARLRDKNREGWSWERVLDWGTSALGGLPVIGDAASVVKAGSNLVKLANRSARVGSFIGMAFSAVNMPEAWDSIKKIYDKGITSMTPQDILNITYGLMGLFAGIKTINSVNARQKPQTATEHSIEIDGKKVKLPDQATADKVSAEYKAAKNNTEASLKVVKMQEVREAAKKAGIEVTDASKVTSGSGFLRGNLVSRKLGMGKSPVKSELVNTGEMTGGSTNGYYMPSLRRSFLNLEQKEVKNPLRKTFDWFLGKTPEVKSTETPKTTSEASKTTEKRTWAEIEKEPKKWSQSTEAKEYKEMLKGNYSSNAIQGGTHKIGDLTIDVDIPRPEATNGFAEVTFSNGNKQTIKFDNLKQLQELIAKIVKERRVQTDSSGKKTKVDVKEIGKILKEFKAKGWLKQGGTIDKQKIQLYKKYINK